VASLIPESKLALYSESDCAGRIARDDRRDTGEEMAFPDRRTLNALLTIFFFALVCATIYAARLILLIFIFAILFAYLIDPVVKFLQRHSLFFKNLRSPAVVEV
jgi:hypothetical protein